ncbi:hypothetical protein DQ04_00571140 [Trypanosoma grayi]|uniref:hypothetical protein n=1 Tax=Trypanosoma grayi TaxID=71804 RepID=UPI0004F46D9F|nr:hypothetical protein DQ04_00571140 [Trypanosoma grayi]KEG14219.1 hypothetical protein DQ04_00571140 [Trypanosoma grayi]
MYSDGDRKTISELQRAAEATRARIAEEKAQLERVLKATARARRLIDELFNLFARELEKEERNALMTVLTSLSEEINLSEVPLLPVAIALANGNLDSAKYLRAAGNRFADDSSVIFLAYVLRFSPAILQVELLDISRTKVTEKGLVFLLEMMAERKKPFTLIATDRVSPVVSPPGDYNTRFEEALRKVRKNESCTVTL